MEETIRRRSIKRNNIIEIAQYQTPKDDSLPFPYELLFNRKPTFFISEWLRTTKSLHPKLTSIKNKTIGNKTIKQDFTAKKATHDRKPFQPGKPVNIYNTINKECRETTEHLKSQKHPVKAVTNTSTNHATTNQLPWVD